LYENKTMKPIEVILSREREVKEKDGGNEPNQDTLYAYMEMSQ
jgi:hypothetical protein